MEKETINIDKPLSKKQIRDRAIWNSMVILAIYEIPVEKLRHLIRINIFPEYFESFANIEEQLIDCILEINNYKDEDKIDV